jgi:hypothetical protein
MVDLGGARPLAGRVAVVTGGASGIGHSVGPSAWLPVGRP